MNYILCGPPGSGKSHYVETHKKSGDVIADIDAIYHAITGLPLYDKPVALLDMVLKINNFIIQCMRSTEYQHCFYNAWVITGGADLDTRRSYASRLDAKVIVFETSPNDCLRAIANDPRRKDAVRLWEPIIYKWWREYRPSQYDTVIKNQWEGDKVEGGKGG